VYFSPVSVRMNKLRRTSWPDHLGELGLGGKVVGLTLLNLIASGNNCKHSKKYFWLLMVYTKSFSSQQGECCSDFENRNMKVICNLL